MLALTPVLLAFSESMPLAYSVATDAANMGAAAAVVPSSCCCSRTGFDPCVCTPSFNLTCEKLCDSDPFFDGLCEAGCDEPACNPPVELVASTHGPLGHYCGEATSTQYLQQARFDPHELRWCAP